MPAPQPTLTEEVQRAVAAMAALTGGAAPPNTTVVASAPGTATTTAGLAGLAGEATALFAVAPPWWCFFGPLALVGFLARMYATWAVRSTLPPNGV